MRYFSSLKVGSPPSVPLFTNSIPSRNSSKNDSSSTAKDGSECVSGSEGWRCPRYSLIGLTLGSLDSPPLGADARQHNLDSVLGTSGMEQARSESRPVDACKTSEKLLVRPMPSTSRAPVIEEKVD